MGLRVKPGDLGSDLRRARERANLSQAELALKLGVAARTVQYWEAGKTPYPRHRRAIRNFIDAVDGVAA